MIKLLKFDIKSLSISLNLLELTIYRMIFNLSAKYLRMIRLCFQNVKVLESLGIKRRSHYYQKVGLKVFRKVFWCFQEVEKGWIGNELVKISENHKNLQSCSQYFENFSWLEKFSFHSKWNEAWLLLINWYVRVTSRVAEQRKT